VNLNAGKASKKIKLDLEAMEKSGMELRARHPE
jgi:hypothetical protein